MLIVTPAPAAPSPTPVATVAKHSSLITIGPSDSNSNSRGPSSDRTLGGSSALMATATEQPVHRLKLTSGGEEAGIAYATQFIATASREGGVGGGSGGSGSGGTVEIVVTYRSVMVAPGEAVRPQPPSDSDFPATEKDTPSSSAAGGDVSSTPSQSFLLTQPTTTPTPTPTAPSSTTPPPPTYLLVKEDGDAERDDSGNSYAEGGNDNGKRSGGDGNKEKTFYTTVTFLKAPGTMSMRWRMALFIPEDEVMKALYDSRRVVIGVTVGIMAAASALFGILIWLALAPLRRIVALMTLASYFSSACDPDEFDGCPDEEEAEEEEDAVEEREREDGSTHVDDGRSSFPGKKSSHAYPAAHFSPRDGDSDESAFHPPEPQPHATALINGAAPAETASNVSGASGSISLGIIATLRQRRLLGSIPSSSFAGSAENGGQCPPTPTLAKIKGSAAISHHHHHHAVPSSASDKPSNKAFAMTKRASGNNNSTNPTKAKPKTAEAGTVSAASAEKERRRAAAKARQDIINDRRLSIWGDLRAIQTAFWHMNDEVKALKGYIPEHVREQIVLQKLMLRQKGGGGGNGRDRSGGGWGGGGGIGSPSKDLLPPPVARAPSDDLGDEDEVENDDERMAGGRVGVVSPIASPQQQQLSPSDQPISVSNVFLSGPTAASCAAPLSRHRANSAASLLSLGPSVPLHINTPPAFAITPTTLGDPTRTVNRGSDDDEGFEKDTNGATAAVRIHQKTADEHNSNGKLIAPSQGAKRNSATPQQPHGELAGMFGSSDCNYYHQAYANAYTSGGSSSPPPPPLPKRRHHPRFGAPPSPLHRAAVVHFGDSSLIDRDVTVVSFNLVQFHDYARATHGETLTREHGALINFIHSRARRCGGSLETFSGDRFLVSFDATSRCDDAAIVACVFANEVATAVNDDAVRGAVRRQINAERRAANAPSLPSAAQPRHRFRSAPFGLSGGIAAGRAHVGPLGSDHIRRHTIISNAVTEAAALERQSLRYPGCAVMIAEGTIQRVEGYVQYLLLDASLLPGSGGARRLVASVGRPMLAHGRSARVLTRGAVTLPTSTLREKKNAASLSSVYSSVSTPASPVEKVNNGPLSIVVVGACKLGDADSTASEGEDGSCMYDDIEEEEEEEDLRNFYGGPLFPSLAELVAAVRRRTSPYATMNEAFMAFLSGSNVESERLLGLALAAIDASETHHHSVVQPPPPPTTTTTTTPPTFNFDKSAAKTEKRGSKRGGAGAVDVNAEQRGELRVMAQLLSSLLDPSHGTDGRTYHSRLGEPYEAFAHILRLAPPSDEVLTGGHAL